MNKFKAAGPDWLIILVTTGMCYLSIVLLSVNPMMSLLVILACVLCFSYSPLYYEIDGDELSIKRKFLFKTIRIPLKSIKEARKLPVKDIYLTFRFFGIGGLFCWGGLFWTAGIGKYLMSATNMNKLVLIEAGKRYVISPKNVEQFIEFIRNKAGKNI